MCFKKRRKGREAGCLKSFKMFFQWKSSVLLFTVAFILVQFSAHCYINTLCVCSISFIIIRYTSFSLITIFQTQLMVDLWKNTTLDWKGSVLLPCQHEVESEQVRICQEEKGIIIIYNHGAFKFQWYGNVRYPSPAFCFLINFVQTCLEVCLHSDTPVTGPSRYTTGVFILKHSPYEWIVWLPWVYQWWFLLIWLIVSFKF